MSFLRRIGRPPKPMAVKIARFWDRKVVSPTGCWEWAGARDKDGYGQTPPLDGRSGAVRAHRLAWTLTNGPIPKGLLVCHHCDNPACINPDHLWLGTSTDNNRDRERKGRGRYANVTITHCPRGHEYSGERWPSSGQRICRTCQQAKYASQRAATANRRLTHHAA